MGDLFDDLYRPRATRYGDDIEFDDTGDALPDRHGYRYHLATGCRCGACVKGCESVQEDAARKRNKPRPWSPSRPSDHSLTYEEWKAARA